jgi:hypothetical protein
MTGGKGPCQRTAQLTRPIPSDSGRTDSTPTYPKPTGHRWPLAPGAPPATPHGISQCRRLRRGARADSRPTPIPSPRTLRTCPPKPASPPFFMSLLTGCSQRLTRFLDPAIHPRLPVCPSFADHPNDAEGRGRVVSDIKQRADEGADRRRPALGAVVVRSQRAGLAVKGAPRGRRSLGKSFAAPALQRRTARAWAAMLAVHLVLLRVVGPGRVAIRGRHRAVRSSREAARPSEPRSARSRRSRRESRACRTGRLRAGNGGCPRIGRVESSYTHAARPR